MFGIAPELMELNRREHPSEPIWSPTHPPTTELHTPNTELGHGLQYIWVIQALKEIVDGLDTDGIV